VSGRMKFRKKVKYYGCGILLKEARGLPILVGRSIVLAIPTTTSFDFSIVVHLNNCNND
jgi:hypothetical protein